MDEKIKKEEERIIQEFIKSKEMMEKFIKEELNNIRSPIKEKSKNNCF